MLGTYEKGEPIYITISPKDTLVLRITSEYTAQGELIDVFGAKLGEYDLGLEYLTYSEAVSRGVDISESYFKSYFDTVAPFVYFQGFYYLVDPYR